MPSEMQHKLGREDLEPMRWNLLNLIPLVLFLWRRQINGWFVVLLV